MTGSVLGTRGTQINNILSLVQGANGLMKDNKHKPRTKVKLCTGSY